MTSIINDSIIIRPLVKNGSKEVMQLSKKVDVLVQEYAAVAWDRSIKAIDINTKGQMIDGKRATLNELMEAASVLIPICICDNFSRVLFLVRENTKISRRVTKKPIPAND